MTLDIEGKQPAKRKTKAGPRGQKKRGVSAVCVMHESNFALCLASGFLGPRVEESAAVDHHQRNGGLTISFGNPLEVHLQLAMGGLDYGNLVAIELTSDALDFFRVSGASEEIAERPLPLSCVARVFARSEVERNDIVARFSAYSDVPTGLFEIDIDSERFMAAQSKLRLEPEGTMISSNWREIALEIDKLAGALAAVVHLGCGRKGALAILAEAFNAGPVPLPVLQGIGNRLVEAVDADATQGAAGALLNAWIKILGGKVSSEGFDSSLLLEELTSVASNESERHLFGSFCKHAGDVASARRELGQDAFVDMPGKILSRAMLLSLLNMDPDRLQVALQRIPNIGVSVFLLASYFVGAAYGLSRLPNSIKVVSKESFLAIASVTAVLYRGTLPGISKSTVWDEDGLGECRFKIGDLAISEPAIASDYLRRVMVEAREVGLDARFGREDGVLRFFGSDGSAQQRCRVVSSLWLPTRDVLEISDDGAAAMSKRKAETELLAAAVSFEDSKVLARMKPSGKLFVVERFVQCELDSPSVAYKSACERLAAVPRVTSDAATAKGKGVAATAKGKGPEIA